MSVRLYRKDEQDFVEITTSPHGDPIYGRRTLYDGLVSELCQHEPLNRLRKSA
ncbi:MAG TPA: hypothetical protein VNR89_04170 [Roseomonas sp.]|nr:hypothetical protein [Roseomonas sp.]